jgi:hypothetical protein
MKWKFEGEAMVQLKAKTRKDMPKRNWEYRSRKEKRNLGKNKIIGKGAGELGCHVQLIRGGTVEDLGVTVVDAVVVVLLVGADKGLLEHEALAGITARHHIDRGAGGKVGGEGHFLLILLVIRANKGVHRGTLLGVGQGRLERSEGDGSSGGSSDGSSGRRDRKSREGLGIETVDGNDGSSGSGAVGAVIDGLDFVAGLLILLVHGGEVLADKTGDIGEVGSSRSRQIGGQLGRIDVRDQEGQKLLLGRRERRREQ